jgi:hypothetical protein
VSDHIREIVERIRDAVNADWLPDIYRDKIRTQRTRSVNLEIPERLNAAEIQYTLLGIELKVGKRRFGCPDLATARYMRVFARCGVGKFAIPYDITRISIAADELETSWQRLVLSIEKESRGRPARTVSLANSRLLKTIREDIKAIGSGDAMPAFDRETRQRK